MIAHPVALALVLTAVVAGVLAARRAPACAPAFRFLPVPFWCYFIPMVLATFGLFPSESPVYIFLARYALPFCLALLLMDVDIPALAGLGRRALFVMAAAAGGIVLGAIVSFAVFHDSLPPDAWKAMGALCGSWIGGSANMLAIKEALGTPEAVFAPVVIVDTFLAYGWMALLIFGAGFQGRFDAAQGLSSEEPAAFSGPDRSAAGREGFVHGLAAAFVLAGLAIGVGGLLPAVGSVLTKGTWTMLLVTTSSLAFSFFHHGRFKSAAGRRLEGLGTSILYILLASMGARARLSAIVEAPTFLLAGLLWMAVHGAVLLAAGRLLKAPMFLLASASQACVGGPISAPIVAAVYRPALAAVGLLLAVLGNVFGTYLGLATSRVLEWISK